MVENIHQDFVKLVSKKRKLEKEIIEDEVGALIFNSYQAKKNFLIDDQISLDDLLTQIKKEKNFDNVKIIKNIKQKEFFFDQFISAFPLKNNYFEEGHFYICNKIKTNIVSILSYSSIGC